MAEISTSQDDLSLGGGGALLARKDNQRSDLNLLGRAIRQGWNIPDRLFVVLPKVVAKIALNKHENVRDRLRAVEVVAKMHGQNQADDPAPQEVNHNVNIASSIRQEIQADSEYLEFLHQKALREDCVTGVVCEGGVWRRLEGRPSPSDDQ